MEIEGNGKFLIKTFKVTVTEDEQFLEICGTTLCLELSAYS